MTARPGPLASLAVLVALATAAPLAAQHHHHARPDDARQRVVLPAPAREKVLAEMRAMLESVHGILRALAAGDLAAAEKAARASGLGAAADMDPAVKSGVPAPFLQLGMQTHRGFDRLADELRAGASAGDALARLADVTSACVACHAAYRLDTAHRAAH